MKAELSNLDTLVTPFLTVFESFLQKRQQERTNKQENPICTTF